MLALAAPLTAQAEVEVLPPDAPALIQTTGAHPFWSETRQAWVPARELRAGEELRTQSGAAVTVASLACQPGSQPVFNLEVETEHVFFVSDAGVLVHNSCFTSSYIDKLVLGSKNAKKFQTRAPAELKRLRLEFDKEVRPEYLKHMAQHERGFLEAKGFTASEISRMVEGKMPDGWVTHHIEPLYRGGTNNFDNFDMMRETYHKQNFNELHYYEPGHNPYGVD